MGEIKKRLPLQCPACDAPLREIHFGPAPNPVWLVLCGRASDGVAVGILGGDVLCRMLISHLYG